MPKSYSYGFQGSPCNKKWYDYFRNNTEHWDLECSVEFCNAKTVKIGTTNVVRMFPVTLATNLQCKSTTIYNSKSSSLTSYPLTVHQLVNCNVVDELDPRGLDAKIPSANFSFKVEGITKDTPLDDIDTILATFDNKMVRIWRGFESHTGDIYDENGRWGLDYYTDFIHDTMCLGNYIVTDRKFNYETQLIEVTCEHMFAHSLSQADAYLPMAKDGSSARSDVLRQRYPYPFAAVTVQGGDAQHPIKQVDTFKLGYTSWEMLRCRTYATFEGGSIPVYGYGYESPSKRESHGVDTHSFVVGLTDVQSGTNNWWALAQTEELQKATSSTTAPPVYSRNFGNAIDDYLITQFNNTWKNETALSSVNMFNLMNRLRFIPAGPFTQSPEETRKISNVETAPGAWRVINGLTPLDNQVFLDTTKVSTWNMATNGSNGVYFPAILNTPYKVTPTLMISTTAQKQEIEWEEVTWVKSYYMDLNTLRLNQEFRRYSFQDIPLFSSNVDMWDATNNNPYPSSQTNGFEVVSTQPLVADEWYDSRSSTLFGSFGDITNLFGHEMPATNQMGQVNIPNRGDSLSAYKVLWNNRLTTPKNALPFGVALVVGKPTIYARDINDALIDINSTENDKGIESEHIYGYYKGLTKRILNRVNNGDVNTKPLFELTWTMVDDPSLRIGTVVWVPLQNEYLKVYITRQERTFDGGARLTCTGWCYAKTNEPVYSSGITNAKVKLFVNSPDVEPRGEWTNYSWTPSGSWGGTEEIFYNFYWQENASSPKVLVGQRMIMFGGDDTVIFNSPEVRERLGIPQFGLSGVYTMQAFFPPKPYEVNVICSVTTIPWDNEKYSYLPAGYVRASNEHQPLIMGNLLQG